LAPWAYLVGHCWTGPAPVPGGTDRHCFESVYDGQHVRDRHVVTIGGREVYAGESLYSVRGNKVVFTYWNSMGGFGTGGAAFASGKWTFTGTIHASPDGAEEPIAATWRRVSGGYEVLDSPTASPRLFRQAD
jgi:hypothetical protein